MSELEERGKGRRRAAPAVNEGRRRTFKLLGGLLLAGGGAVTVAGFWMDREGRIDEWVEIGPVADLPQGEIVRRSLPLTERGIWFSRPVEKIVWLRRNADDTVMVLSGACPHGGCTANWKPESNLFDCLCHGSMFDPTGRALAGPVQRAMDTLEQQIENGVLRIRYQTFRQGLPTKQAVG